jgi:hypothetical protein
LLLHLPRALILPLHESSWILALHNLRNYLPRGENTVGFELPKPVINSSIYPSVEGFLEGLLNCSLLEGAASSTPNLGGCVVILAGSLTLITGHCIPIAFSW